MELASEAPRDAYAKFVLIGVAAVVIGAAFLWGFHHETWAGLVFVVAATGCAYLVTELSLDTSSSRIVGTACAVAVYYYAAVVYLDVKWWAFLVPLVPLLPLPLYIIRFWKDKKGELLHLLESSGALVATVASLLVALYLFTV